MAKSRRPTASSAPTRSLFRLITWVICISLLATFSPGCVRGAIQGSTVHYLPLDYRVFFVVAENGTVQCIRTEKEDSGVIKVVETVEDCKLPGWVVISQGLYWKLFRQASECKGKR